MLAAQARALVRQPATLGSRLPNRPDVAEDLVADSDAALFGPDACDTDAPLQRALTHLHMLLQELRVPDDPHAEGRPPNPAGSIADHLDSKIAS